MLRKVGHLERLWGVVFLPLVMVFGVGCAPENYHEQADEAVYEIIDEGWDDSYGPRSNYIVDDVYGGAGRANVVELIPESGVLGLAEAVRIATLGNRTYQSQKETLYSAALSLTSARHEFEPQLYGLLGGGYTRSAGDETLDLGAQAGVTQSLVTGADIGLAIATDWLRYLTGDPRTSLGSVLSATVRQPLLRGAGRMIARENLTQSERNTVYAMRTFARYRKTFVVQVVTEYYRVLQRRDSVENARNNFERLRMSEERITNLAQAGRIRKFEVEQSQQQTLTAYDGYVQAVESYGAALDSFKLTLGVSPDLEFELDPCELTAFTDIEIAEPNFDVGIAIETALKQRLDLQTAYDRVEDAERQVVVARDALQASLDIVGSTSVDSQEYTRFGELRFDEGTYGLGFDLDLGLDRLNERNSYRQALISLEQQRRSYEDSVDNVSLGIRQEYRDLRQAAAQYRIQQLSLELAMRRVDNTALLLDAGRAITRDLLEAQAALLAAQNARTSALVNYITASLNFARDVGTLELRPDGTWVEITPEEAASATEVEATDRQQETISDE
ncbi:MAG: TolC family protein [Sedimentisphaerales bacterium]|nr:TolC family protein [Sedimentisphaerales bacterium]